MTERQFVQKHKEALGDTLNSGGPDGGLDSATSRAWHMAEDADMPTEQWTQSALMGAIKELHDEGECRRRIIGYNGRPWAQEAAA